MIDSATKRISRSAVRNRREEIDERLAACGLARGPRRLFRGNSRLDFEKSPSLRLRAALESLGPVFAAFALYMSSRVDLWPAKDCLQLATIPDRKAPTPTNVVWSLFSREIGFSPEQAFSVFENQPFESRLLFQSHYARLVDGVDVIVKIIHPETEDQLYDLDLLPLLKGPLVGCGLSDHAFDGALGDFYHSLQQQMDLAHDARGFRALAQDAEDYDVFRAPRVYAPLCASRVLTIEKLSGVRLDEFLVEPQETANRGLLERVGFERSELGRLLCEVWLRQALLGRCFPIEPGPSNVLALPGKQVAFTGGSFAALALEPQANLWSYLLAVSADDSDKACSCLLREMKREGTRVGEDEVRQRFRQAMPFRDGGWDDNSSNKSLAELLFVQWRFATECGYTPLMHLPAFYRGLFKIADTATRLAPHSDPLADGVRDMRLVAGLEQFTKMLGQRQLADQMDRYAALLVDFPHRIDQALTFGAEGRARLDLQTTDLGHHGAGTSSAILAALLLVFAAVSLLSHYITPLVAPVGWANRINTGVFLIFGALLLRAVSRAGEKRQRRF